MHEEKKSEASGKEPEWLGPYLIQEEVRPSAPGQAALYLATHETSGATALLLKLTARQAAALRKSWRVFLGYWASGGFFALHVEHTPWSRAQDRQSVESLLFTFAAVLDGVRRMARVVPKSASPALGGTWDWRWRAPPRWAPCSSCWCVRPPCPNRRAARSRWRAPRPRP